jgi:hypothetical protein
MGSFTIPGALKNALDWISRTNDQPFKDEPVTIQAATGGSLGAARAKADTAVRSPCFADQGSAGVGGPLRRSTLLPPSKPRPANSKIPGRTLFDPVEFIPSILKNSALRLAVVTDPADQNVPVKLQTGFVEKLHRAGRDIPQFFVTAVDDNHHGVLAYTELVAAGCILGKSNSEIATAIGTIVKRNTEFNEQRRKEIAALAKNGIASRQPLDHRAAPAGGHGRISKSRTSSQ